MEQLSLFDSRAGDADIEKISLFALGEFQARKKVLAERELALDRLRGAFRRAAERFGVQELSDDAIADALRSLGARVIEIPRFVAKHPYRVTVPLEIAERAKRFYGEAAARGNS